MWKRKEGREAGKQKGNLNLKLNEDFWHCAPMPKPHSRQWVTVDVFLLEGLMLAFVGFVGISHAGYSRSNGDRGNSRGDGGE